MINALLERLNERERRILCLAAPVIALLLAYLLVSPLVAQRAEANLRLNRAVDNIAWFQSRIHRSEISGNLCRGYPVGTNIAHLASRFQLRLADAPSRWDGKVSFAVAQANGNHAVQYLRALTCAGLQIDSFELDSIDAAGRVSGHISASRL